MAIPKELLKLTVGNALGMAVYGGPGTRKTSSIHTLPPPILLLDFEVNYMPLMPWIRNMKANYTDEWVQYSQEEREAMHQMTIDKQITRIKPQPLIDVICLDNMSPQDYNNLVGLLSGTFVASKYNSLACDSITEAAVLTQSFTKSGGNVSADVYNTVMAGTDWMGAQERASILIRRIKSLRTQGVFTLCTGGELIDKEYVNSPISGSRDEPISIQGTLNLPGKLVGMIQHNTNVILRARGLNKEIRFVAKQESLPAGAAWHTKDSTGRLIDFNQPNWRDILACVYTPEGRDAIYKHCKENM